MTGYLVRVSREIAAPATALFEVLADPAMHPRIDGSGSVRALRADAPARLALGATFAMDMHIRADYVITNTVVEYEEGRRLAWRHFNGHVWRYLLEPLTPDRTRVIEEWDARRAHFRRGLRLIGVPRRTEAAMRSTLKRLAALTETRATDS